MEESFLSEGATLLLVATKSGNVDWLERTTEALRKELSHEQVQIITRQRTCSQYVIEQMIFFRLFYILCFVFDLCGGRWYPRRQEYIHHIRWYERDP